MSAILFLFQCMEYNICRDHEFILSLYPLEHRQWHYWILVWHFYGFCPNEKSFFYTFKLFVCEPFTYGCSSVRCPGAVKENTKAPRYWRHWRSPADSPHKEPIANILNIGVAFLRVLPKWEKLFTKSHILGNLLGTMDRSAACFS